MTGGTDTNYYYHCSLWRKFVGGEYVCELKIVFACLLKLRQYFLK